MCFSQWNVSGCDTMKSLGSVTPLVLLSAVIMGRCLLTTESEQDDERDVKGSALA